MQLTATKETKPKALFSLLPQWILIALFAFPALPLNVTNILFIVFSTYVLLYWIYLKPLPLWKEIRFNALLLLPFIPYLAELVLHPQSGALLFEFQKKIPFFIAPFSIPVFIRLFEIKDSRPYFASFTLSVIALTLYAVFMLIAGGTLLSPASYDNAAYLLRLRFEAYSHLHPTYYSLFAAAAVCWILYGHARHPPALRPLYYAGAICMFMLSLLLAAKMPLLILTAGIFYILYLQIKNRKKLVLMYTALLAVICTLAFMLPSLESRVSELRSYAAGTGENTIRQRKIIFDCSLDVFKEHFFTGAGAAHTQLLLDECYQSKAPAMERYKFNPHNQYLSIGISYGILILLLFLFAIGVIAKHTRNNTFGLIIMASSLLIMLTESVLERQMGIYFCLLFWLLNANLEENKVQHPQAGAAGTALPHQ